MGVKIRTDMGNEGFISCIQNLAGKHEDHQGQDSKSLYGFSEIPQPGDTNFSLSYVQ